MRRRHLLMVTGSAVIGAGCIGSPDQSDDSPTGSASDITTNSESPTPTKTTECETPDLHVRNYISPEATVHLSITANTRWRGGSPTPTTVESGTPTETPVETFSDAVTLDTDEASNYENVTVKHGSVLEVIVEDGPAEKFSIEPSMVANTKSLNILIEEDEILFSNPYIDC